MLSRKLTAWSVTHARNVRATAPVTFSTVDVIGLGLVTISAWAWRMRSATAAASPA
jgi:hypothetical protein